MSARLWKVLEQWNQIRGREDEEVQRALRGENADCFCIWDPFLCARLLGTAASWEASTSSWSPTNTGACCLPSGCKWAECYQGHFRWPYEEKLNNRRKQVLNYPPRRGEPGTRQEGHSCLSGISPPLTSHKHEEPPWNTPSCLSHTLVCSGWLKDSKIIFQSMFLSLHKEFRMSLKVNYSALQKAGQQGIFFSDAAKCLILFSVV